MNPTSITKKSSILFLGVLSCIFNTACHSDKSKMPTPSGYVDEDTTQVTLEEAGGDTLLVGSNEYFEAAKNLEILERRMQAIKSPDMLLNMVCEYNELMANAQSLNEKVTNPKEQHRIDSLMLSIKLTYKQARKNNVVPAISLIENLQYVKKRLLECSSHAELCRIIDFRYDFFQHIESIHLIVEEPEKEHKVHSLAKEVKRLLLEKKQKYGVK